MDDLKDYIRNRLRKVSSDKYSFYKYITEDTEEIHVFIARGTTGDCSLQSDISICKRVEASDCERLPRHRCLNEIKARVKGAVLGRKLCTCISNLYATFK